MAALEDAGFYCVDNMPVDLLPKFLDLPMERDSEITGIALVMDLRGKGFIAKYDSVFNELQQKGYYFEILFLEAEEEILVQRYSTTRRQHPLSSEKSLWKAATGVVSADIGFPWRFQARERPGP